MEVRNVLWKKNDGSFVFGDGDDTSSDYTQATQAEIDAFNNDPVKIVNEKWHLVDTYELNLTITLENGHKYAVNKNARLNIVQERDSLLGIGANATETWIEEWGTFSTNAIELQEVLDRSINLIRAYRNSVFGV